MCSLMPFGRPFSRGAWSDNLTPEHWPLKRMWKPLMLQRENGARGWHGHSDPTQSHLPSACTHVHVPIHTHTFVSTRNTPRDTFVHLGTHACPYSHAKYITHTYSCFCTIYEQSQDSQEKRCGFNWLMEISLGTFISSA